LCEACCEHDGQLEARDEDAKHVADPMPDIQPGPKFGARAEPEKEEKHEESQDKVRALLG